MYKTLPKANLAKWLFYAIPIGVLVYLVIEIFAKISHQEFVWQGGVMDVLPGLSVILLLSYLNLYCEMRKWATLVGNNGSRALAWKAVMAGMVGGFLTPNRIGDIAGKTLAAPAGARSSSFLASALGSLLQGLVTVFFGLWAMVLYPIALPTVSSIWGGWKLWFALMAILVSAVGIYWSRDKINKKWKPIYAAAKELSRFRIMKASGWALLRYAIFATQLYLALGLVGISLSWFSAYSAIALLYLFQTYFPFSSFGDLGVREIFAMAIFSPMVEFAPLAAAATLLVWLINIAIPVGIGAVGMRKLIPVR